MSHFQQITPDDANDLPASCPDFFIGGAGDLAVVAQGDDVADAVVLTAVSGLLRLPWPIRRILASGTSATGIIALGL